MPLTDTVPEPVNNYFELKWEESVFLQGRIYQNTDGTKLVALKGIHSDQQCSFHYLYFFEYSPKTDSLKELSAEKVFPQPGIHTLLVSTGPPVIFKKYIAAYNKEHAGEPQTVDWLLGQVYSFKHLLSSKNPLLTLTLQVCDVELSYLPVELTAAENKIIDTGFKKVSYKYNPVKKSFVLNNP